MLINIHTLKNRIEAVILNKGEQGYEINGSYEKFQCLPNRYDDLIEFAITLNDLNIRKDWKYIEPNELENIWSEADSTRPIGRITNVNITSCSKKLNQRFLSSVCGCILGKPLESWLTGREIKKH